jgi:CheY-like chemotaxis protein
MSRILAIDDDDNTLKLLNKQISSLGHTLVTASSGEEGLEMAASGNPELILLDIMMPGMNGFEVIKRLRKNELTRSKPIIMLTSKTGKEYVTEAMRHGVVDYLIKPYNYFQLSNKITSALNQASGYQTESDELVAVKRDRGLAIVEFRSKLADKKLIQELRSIFTPTFIKQTSRDIKVLDIRGVPEVEENDLSILNTIISIISASNLHVIAGTHYGTIVSSSDLEENIHLYITFGDFELWFNKL